MRWIIFLLLPLVCSACNGGKHYTATTTQPASPTTGLEPHYPIEIIQAIVSPPTGWKQEAHKVTPRSEHDIWISPSGSTAYGVLFIRLPLPVGANLTLNEFLKGMREREHGVAKLLEKQDDPAIDGIRFVAEGGIHKLRAKLMTRGFRAWVIYAGTLVAKPERPDELELAERAREATIIGLPAEQKQ